MPVIGRTRVISEGLQALYEKLVAAVERVAWPGENSQ
jgi:hypothetical protein